MAALFRSRGFGGMAVLGRHPFAPPGGWAATEQRCGLLHFDGGYADDYSSDDDLRNTTETYADHVANYTPPISGAAGGRVVLSTTTSKCSHYPHPPGMPQLFEEELEKAVVSAEQVRGRFLFSKFPRSFLLNEQDRPPRTALLNFSNLKNRLFSFSMYRRTWKDSHRW